MTGFLQKWKKIIQKEMTFHKNYLMGEKAKIQTKKILKRQKRKEMKNSDRKI